MTFGYPGGARPVLRACSLEVPAGKITAVVGANGSGKSTLVKLLCRLYDPAGGRVTLDGVDLRGFGVDELRGSFPCSSSSRCATAPPRARTSRFGGSAGRGGGRRGGGERRGGRGG